MYEVLQGNCTGAPPAFALPASVPLAAPAAGQCVIVSNRDTLSVPEPDQRLWLHNILMRVARTSPDQVCPVLRSGSACRGALAAMAMAWPGHPWKRYNGCVRLHKLHPQFSILVMLQSPGNNVN